MTMEDVLINERIQKIENSTWERYQAAIDCGNIDRATHLGQRLVTIDHKAFEVALGHLSPL